MSFANLKRSSANSMKDLAEKFQKEKTGGGFGPDERFWNPEIDKAGNGYAVIRFLPAPEGHDLPYVKTYSHGFKEGQRWFIEECPTTIGQPCPCCDANSELWETGDKEKQAVVRNRKRQLRYVSNILVITDPKHPENEGKVFLFKFGKKIFEKITQAIEPEFEDEKAVNPFDLWEGANFKLKIRNVENFRNYDKSEFEESSPLLGGDDAALEALWKSEYNLQQLIAPSVYKDYDALKTKLTQVISGSAATQQARGDLDDRRVESATAAATPTRQTAAAPTRPAATDTDDDDMAAYAALLAD